MSLPSDELFVAEVLRALNDVGLEAIIVGSVAAALQGVPIVTLDLDLLVRDTPANREKIEELAKRLGAARPISIGPLTSALRIIGSSAPVDVMFDEISGSQSLRSRAQRIVV